MRVTRRKESINNYIIGGTLRMDKRLFTRESMKAGSYLRMLLGLEESYCKKVTNIERDGQDVIIHYGHDELVYLPNDIKRFFKEVKEAYGQAIKGRIEISISYDMVEGLELKVDF